MRAETELQDPTPQLTHLLPLGASFRLVAVESVNAAGVCAATLGSQAEAEAPPLARGCGICEASQLFWSNSGVSLNDYN